MSLAKLIVLLDFVDVCFYILVLFSSYSHFCVHFCNKFADDLKGNCPIDFYNFRPCITNGVIESYETEILKQYSSGSSES